MSPMRKTIMNFAGLESSLALFAVMACVAARAAETPVVRGAEKAVAVAEKVEGAEEVKLTATIGPDTYDFDQAIWCEPDFVMKDGSRVDATTLPMLRSDAGWGKVECNRVNWGGSKKAKVGDETFTRFISAHAPSCIILAVPKGAVRFEAQLHVPRGGWRLLQTRAHRAPGDWCEGFPRGDRPPDRAPQGGQSRARGEG